MYCTYCADIHWIYVLFSCKFRNIGNIVLCFFFRHYAHDNTGKSASMDTADTFDTTDGPTDAYDLAHHGTPDSPGHDVSDAPGIHHTHDYFRTGPDGSPQHVSGYDATNPDGIVENNFSYHGAASHDGTADAAPADSISAETVDHAMDSLDAAADSRPAFLQAKEDNKRKQPPAGKEIINLYEPEK